jgi:hypothetical protein
MLRGWHHTAASFEAAKFRRHLIRPAWQGEHSDQHQRSIPAAIVACRLEWLGAFSQLTVSVSPEIVDTFRDDCGEAIARATYELADESAQLQRREIIDMTTGEPRIVGLRVHGGAEPNAAWVVAHWARNPRCEWIDPGWLRRAGMTPQDVGARI